MLCANNRVRFLHTAVHLGWWAWRVKGKRWVEGTKKPRAGPGAGCVEQGVLSETVWS